MRNITIKYNIENQFSNCSLDNGEQEINSALALYRKVCEIMNAKHPNYKFTSKDYSSNDPEAPEVWSVMQYLEHVWEDWILKEIQITLEDVMSLGDFWIIK